jgi:hypothetical protein
MRRLISTLVGLSAAAAIRLWAADPAAKLERIEWCDLRVIDAPTTHLPRVLMVGDSICMGYFDKVQAQLKGKAACARLATSKALPSPVFLDELALMLSQYPFDVIHFNNGLHGFVAYSEADYRRSFPALLKLLKKKAPRAKLIWATTTPWRSPAPRLPEFHPNNERVKARNRIAAEFVSRATLPVDDLFGLMENHPECWADDGLHYNAAGQEREAAQVSKYILDALAGSHRE